MTYGCDGSQRRPGNSRDHSPAPGVVAHQGIDDTGQAGMPGIGTWGVYTYAYYRGRTTHRMPDIPDLDLPYDDGEPLESNWHRLQINLLGDTLH